MGFWKVAGGVGAGIGAVVLLPVAGPVLAVTAVGAAVAGTVGGAAGVALSVADKKKLEEAQEEARQEAIDAKKKLELAQKKKAKAKRERAKREKEKQEKERIRQAQEDERKADEEKLEAEKNAKEALEKSALAAFSFIRETDDPFATFIMCFKLQISMANADGTVSEEEQRDVEDFLSTLGDDEKSKKLHQEILEMMKNPPAMDDVFDEIKSANMSKEVLRGYLDLFIETMRADDVIHQSEMDHVCHFVEVFGLEYPDVSLPYRCVHLQRDIDPETAVVAICLESNGGRCEVWVNNEYRLSDRPLVDLSSKNFNTLFDSEALEALDDVDKCRIADHVKFVFCGEDKLFAHAEKVIKGEGDRYSISRCPCCDGAV